MKKNCPIKKISSYIMKKIFEFIKDDAFKFKLFNNSKEFQKKLGISQLNYLEKYLTKIKFNVFKYFSHLFNDYLSQPLNIGNEKALKIFYEKELIKYNIPPKLFSEYLNYFFGKTIKYESILIDIFSPFFELLLNNYPEIFASLFIPIVIELIEKQDLKNDFFNVFNKIKQSSIEYISIFFNFNKTTDINFLKKIAMDLTIHGLFINKNEHFKNNKDNNFDVFFKELFTFNIQNLKSLSIILNGEKISTNLLEKINYLMSLRELVLANLTFDEIFILKLSMLKILYISNCQNITFLEDSFLNLENINILNCFIKFPKSLMKMPDVKKGIFESTYYIIEDYKSIFDYASMENIVELTIGINEFLDLDCSLYKCLIFLRIDFNYYDINQNHYLKYKSHSIGIKMLKKILLIKTLKTLVIPYIDINEKDEVDGQLDSLTQLQIKIDSFILDINRFLFVDRIQNKFPNMVYFSIIVCIDNIKMIIDIKKAKSFEMYKFDCDRNDKIKFFISMTK